MRVWNAQFVRVVGRVVRVVGRVVRVMESGRPSGKE
jgi:hypothetical protein